ncbi:MAG: ATPase, T2SS/T4P/T4SS family [Gemmatimonadaceae bacterium]
MSHEPPRTRDTTDRAEPDEWLIDAARRMGHDVPKRPRTPGTTAWRVLLNAGVPDDEVLRIASLVSGADSADFTRLAPALASLFTHGVALKHRVVPLGVHNGVVAVATTNPMDPVLERELAFAAKQRVRLHPASPAEIIRAQGVVYGAAYGTRADSDIKYPTRNPLPSVTRPEVRPVARLTLSVPVVAPTPSAARSATPAAPSNLTDRLLLAACTERASEAILEPMPDGGMLVRLRVDGALHDRFKIAEPQASQMIGTLKERSGLDIDESRRAQDGRTSFDSPNGRVAIRVTIQSLRAPAGGMRERVVIRLYSSHGVQRLADLGMSSFEQHRFEQLLGTASGLVIVAGPAATGKTTTLYAAARELRHHGRRVMTIEDQIEQPLDGVTQLQLRGSTPSSLSAALPGVVSDGGMSSTVVIADATLDASSLEQCASATDRSRLVIASLETSDLTSTLAHLRALHPDGAPLAASLHGVVVQRLVRRLCTCAMPQIESELPALQQRLLSGLPTASGRHPVGCPTCRSTGYLGRLAIAEVVPVTLSLRDAITRRASPAELVHLARESGIPTLWDSGMQHVLSGATSLAELLDNVAPPETGDAAPQEDIDALLAQLLGGASKTPSAPKPPVAPPARPPVRATVVTAPKPARLRVLLVDGDAEAREVRSRELTLAGFTVIEAVDGASALQLARNVRADAVLTAVALPGLDAIGPLRTRIVMSRDLSTAELVKELHELVRG